MNSMSQRQKTIIREALLTLRDIGELSQSQVKEITSFINVRCVENKHTDISTTGLENKPYEPSINAEKPKMGFHGVKQ